MEKFSQSSKLNDGPYYVGLYSQIFINKKQSLIANVMNSEIIQQVDK